MRKPAQTKRNDDLAVLRKKFEEVDAIVRDYENRLSQFRADFHIAVDSGTLDAHGLLSKVSLGMKSLGILGHTKSLIEGDLKIIQDGLEESQQHGLLNLVREIQNLAKMISISVSTPSIDPRANVINLFDSLCSFTQAGLVPFLTLRDRYRENLNAATPQISRDQQIKLRDRIAKRMRKVNPLISWSELAVRVRDDPEAQELTIPINKNTVRQPFK
ncbi:hypothetical protein ETAA8_45060 [Anatilimnocola aggregata]|uniref:Uncharacterized protein n=1 Tax=Anatilimnocola aggregata TaxID=2528021 RepID=A0A517YGP0_9BACT|nr:hypothetical protein [Anatilimnocola aggregata]QDU29396.1 hypothetical protein ETAA8_45060 [Anatilimnocola aggregata]